MKLSFAFLVSLLLCAVASAREMTVQWEVTALADESLTAGETAIQFCTVAPSKKNDPPRLALFAGESQLSKTSIYPGKHYVIALVERDGKTQCFVNGCADGEPVALMLDGNVKARSSKLKLADRALPAEQILADFKAEISAHPVTVGHRGDNVHSPENTNISYVNAIATSTPIVEMDLRLTSDNVLVLLHDATVDRTTGTTGKQAIVEMAFTDSQKLDAGSWKDKKYKGEPIPAVETVFQTCRGKAVMMLDLKCTGLGKSIAELKSKLNIPSDQLILAPWEEPEGTELRKYLPDVPMILLHGKLPVDKIDDAYFEKMKQIGFSAFSLDWRILSKEFIDAAHKNGMKVYTWTINDSVDIAGAVLNGVDGIITDDPAATMKFISELTAR